jgi:hypothetical protein
VKSEEETEGVKAAHALISEVFSLNKVPVSEGITACFTIAAKMFYVCGVKKEKLLDFQEAINKALEDLGSP